MGNKVSAKEAVRKFGIPVIPGSTGAVRNILEAQSAARTLGHPILIKAAAGGGGRGMNVARDHVELG
jgi:acetyl-CoA carboxylase biotin carboxylase subunit